MLYVSNRRLRLGTPHWTSAPQTSPGSWLLPAEGLAGSCLVLLSNFGGLVPITFSRTRVPGPLGGGWIPRGVVRVPSPLRAAQVQG